MMEFNNDYIENYKKSIGYEFLEMSVEELSLEFGTDRLCWAFIMWTYKKIGLIVEISVVLITAKTQKGRKNAKGFDQHFAPLRNLAPLR